MTRRQLLVVAIVVAILAVAPTFATGATPQYLVNSVLTKSLIYGVVAATIVFLARYGGMTSLGQILFWGTAGFMYGNFVSDSGARGLNLGLNAFWASVLALAIVLVLGLVLGAIGSRATGIYFLMLSLVYAVIGRKIFFSVPELSGQTGITRIRPPSLLSTPRSVYYAALFVAALAYVILKAVGRTNFGLALQGVRDDPVRMAALGFNVPVHRMLAFTLAGFVAGVSGLLNVWWNHQIGPAAIDIGPAIVFLIIAVLGGISSFEGAWVGALVYVLAENYIRELPLVPDQVLFFDLGQERFNTLIGVLVLLIMVLSPEGLAGIAARLRSGRQPRYLTATTTVGELPAPETKGTNQ